MNKKVEYCDNYCIIHGEKYTREDLNDMYITKNYSQSKMCEVLSVSRGTCIKIINKFGLFKDAETVKQNRKNAIVEKYGVESVMLLPEFREKSTQSLIDKYGAKSALCDKQVQDKAAASMYEKYGVRYPSQSKDIIALKKERYLTKYGVSSHWQTSIQHFDIWESKEKMEEFLSSLKDAPTYIELSEYFSVDRTAVNSRLLGWGLDHYINVKPSYSSYESQIIKVLVDDIGIKQSDIQRNVIGLLGDTKKEIDIYLPEYKIGIEFNGDYWHSDIFKTDHNGRSTYHQEKSLLAEKSGIFLFHIFEYEWKDDRLRENICNRLRTILHKNTIKVPARKCKIVELTKRQKKDFLNANHIQGNDHSSKSYGLIYNEEIVSCMTFVKPKNKKYAWELSRFCSKHDTMVQGGASKLFCNFVATLEEGETISSYNDITKTRGDLYRILHFDCVSVNDPNYIWVNLQTGDKRSRYQEQASGEVKRMHDLQYHRICDCGTKTWVYTAHRKGDEKVIYG